MILTEWPEQVPAKRWVYHTCLRYDGEDWRHELPGEFRMTDLGVIAFHDDRGFNWIGADFAAGEKFVRMGGSE